MPRGALVESSLIIERIIPMNMKASREIVERNKGYSRGDKGRRLEDE